MPLPRNQRSGFTLIEVLAVMTVMAVMIGIVTQFMGSTPKPRQASVLVSSVAMNARSQAMSAQQPARMIIDAHFDEANPGHYLRRVATVVWNGEGWVMLERWIQLPETLYLSTDYSSGLHNTMRFNFLDAAPQAGTAGNQVLFIEFDAAGRLVPPSTEEARIVFVSGILDPQSGTLMVPEARLSLRDGFIVRKAGRIAFFEEPDQITLASLP